MRRVLFAAAACAALSVFAAPAAAETTDIIQVPTGEVRAVGSFDLGPTADFRLNDDRDTGDDVGLALQSGFGVFDRLEVGLDIFNIDDDPEVRGDVAYQVLRREGATGLSAKVGVDRIGEEEEMRVFAVGTYDVGAGAFTGGVGYTDDEYGLLFGGELDFANGWGAFGEYSSVSDDEARVGARYAYRPGLRAAVYYAREDSGDSDIIGVELRIRGQLDAIF